MQLDCIDSQVLDALQREGRLKNKDIAIRVGLSASACLERVRRLERNGVIVGYRAIVDHAAIGAPFEVWGEVTLAEPSPDSVARFANLLQRTPAIISAYRLAGRHDFLVHAIAPSLESWNGLSACAREEGIGLAAVNAAVVVERVKSNGPIAVRPPLLRLVEEAA